MWRRRKRRRGKERGDRENNSVGSSSSENNNCNRLSQETEVEYDGGCDQSTKERGVCGSVCLQCGRGLQCVICL